MADVRPDTWEEVGQEWLATRRVIAAFLGELQPMSSEDRRFALADMLIARLASHDPPILTVFYKEDKKTS